MKTKFQLLLSTIFLLQLSACATLDNLIKLPVENLQTSTDYESADFYSGKLLALTVFSPKGSYIDFYHGDSSLIKYGLLFDKTVQEKRPAIDLVTLDQIPDDLSDDNLRLITTRMSGKVTAAPSDITTLAKHSGAKYIAVARIHGFATDQELHIDTKNAFNSGWINYKAARSSFSIYDASTGNKIWAGDFNHTSDDSWGEISWQYMMERMYEGFVLRLPKPSK